MPLVNNRKTANVGLPLTDGSTMTFKPGSHEYPQDRLDKINISRPAVRAYLEGDDPVLTMMGDAPATPPAPPKESTAAEMIESIQGMTDTRELDLILVTDTRKTVVKAAEKRKDELLITPDPEVESDAENG